MQTFLEYILNEAPGDPPAGAAPTGTPPPGGTAPDPSAAGGAPPIDPSGGGMPPGGDMGGGGMPPMTGGGGGGGGMPPGGDPMGAQQGAPAGGAQTPPTKYKPSTVWDVMEKILSGKPINDGNEDDSDVKSSTQPTPTYPSPPVQQQPQPPIQPTGAEANPGQSQVPAF